MIGEDSGIEVDGARRRARARLGAARRRRPGRLAARGARGAQGEDRCGRYVCELVAVSPAGEEVRGTGRARRDIAEAPRGTEGFGYDPVFVPEGETRTVAELGNEWKAQNSHRARAARALLARL